MIAGKFRLTHQLGQGGMGSVWAAVHETLGREVAVKFLQPQSGQRSDVLADRFVSEAHMVASIKHRFVVDVFDFGVTEDGLHYMVLELLHGQSLADRMDHGPALSVRKGVRLMADCLRGLHVVHEAGIVHRDLKPDNIFILEDVDGAFPKLIDFGISRRTDPPNLKLDPAARKSRLTLPGTVLGTPYYMSPEQLRGKQNVGRRSDVYSVGVILYELLAGRLPFRQDNVGDLMVAITVKGPPSLMSVRPDLGEELAAIVRRALAPVAEERYASALELRDALLAVVPRLPEDALCVVQLASDGQEVPLPNDTSLQLAAAQSPFLSSLAAPPMPRSVFARVPKLAWGLLGVGLLAGGVLALARHEEAAELPQPKAASVQLSAVSPGPQGALEVPPEPQPRAAPSAPEAAASGAHAAPRATASAPAAERPTKASRARARSREPGTRTNSAERPQKLYKKLDF